MGRYILRRLLTAVLTLLVISFVLFAILDLAPNDPTADLPTTIPPEVRQQIRQSFGLDEPFHVRYVLWLRQFFINEPLNVLESTTGIQIGDSENRLRVRSWAARSPVIDLIIERTPQTLWVVGLAYALSILIAVPIGAISAYKQYSVFDQVGTLFTIVGYSVPTFFTGLLVIYAFSVKLNWFPSIYDTTHRVTDLDSLWIQFKQMIMPVLVITFYLTAQLSRYTRSSVLDCLNNDYVRTARSKGLRERAVLGTHVLRNSLIPVVTLIALGIPAIFAGAIVTEQIFRVNGLGQLLVIAIQGGDVPLAQTLTFVFAVLVVIFSIMADVLYAVLDPRIRYP